VERTDGISCTTGAGAFCGGGLLAATRGVEQPFKKQKSVAKRAMAIALV
jgi:hypothetical protein